MKMIPLRPARAPITTLLSVLLLSSGMIPSSKAATDVLWSSTAGSTAWATNANWVGGTAPANTTDFAAGSFAVFNQTSYTSQPNTSTTSIYGLRFGDGVTATAASTLTRSSGNFFTIGAGGIDMNANAGAVSLTHGTIRLDGNQTWSNDSSNLFSTSTTATAITNVGNLAPVTLSLTGAGAGDIRLLGIISDGGATGTTAIEVDKTGGIVDLRGANTFTGGLTIKSGVVSGLTNITALGAGPITLGVTSGAADARLNLAFGLIGSAANAVTVASGAGLRTISATQATGLTGLVTLNNDLTLDSLGQNLTMSGGFTGTGNLTFTGNAATRSINLTTAAVAINGTITNSGANTAINTISGGVGSGVTAITQNGLGALEISTNALNVNSGGTTLTLTSVGTKQLKLSGGSAGTGDLIFINNNSAITTVTAPGGGITASDLQLNHSGAIINSGTGATSSGSGVGITASVGSNVTEIRQASATSSLSLSGAVNVNSTATVLRNTMGGVFNVNSATATTGTGNVILRNDSSLNDGINVSGAGGFNHTGLITNSGSGSGSVVISAAIGSNVTGVIQDSATSTLRLLVANTHSGDTTVNAGTLALGNSGVSANSLQNSTLNTGASGSQQVTFGSTYSTYNLGGLKGADALDGANNVLSIGSNNQNTVYSGALSSAGVTKVGTGSLTFSGVNTYNRGTTISAGTLLLNTPKVAGDSGTGTGAVTVSAGTLGGTGIVRPDGSSVISVSSGAFIAPGDNSLAGGIGNLTLDGGGTSGALLTMASGAEFSFQLGTGLSSDQVSFWNYGTSADFVRNNNVINISALLGATDGTYNLFSFYSDNGDTLKAYGFSSGLTLNFIDPGMTGSLSYDFGEINLVMSAIPEPSPLALLAAGSIGLLALRRRRRARAV